MPAKYLRFLYARWLFLLTAGWMLYWMCLRFIARDIHGRLLRNAYIEHWPSILRYGLAVPLTINLLVWMGRAFFRWALRDFLDVPEN